MEKTTFEELHDLYSSPNITGVIKSKRIRWAGHVEHTGGRGEVLTGCWWGDLGNRPLGRPRCS